VPVLAMFLVPAIAQAQFEEGDWTLQLAGQGANDQNFDEGSASVQFDLGYFLTKELNIGVREGLVWADGGSAWGLSSFAYIDYHFDMDRWQPFIGWNIGKACGDAVANDDDWFTGPEAGVKYFVNTTTFIQGTVQYEFNLEEGFDEGAFQYLLGIGFKW
jgi:hypothetical protein